MTRIPIKPYHMYKKLKNAFRRNDNKIISKLYLRARSIRRDMMAVKYSFITVDDLVVWTAEWIKTFPTNYDIIVGIPRSGLLVANIIATKLGKRLTTPELFSHNHYWVSKFIDKKIEYKNILLVDDSISTGKTMEKSLEFLQSHCENLNITKAALIVTKKSKELVDLSCKVIPHPRLFEWNILHAKKGVLAADLDGIICENCPPGVDLDEKLYTEWIKTAKPYLIPSFEIDLIISCRLEKYRSNTEEWLNQHGVNYKELILWNIQSKEERKGKYSHHKIENCLKIKPTMIWESNFGQAKQIWAATRIPTLCFDEMILFS